MKAKNFIIGFFIVFILALGANLLITMCWNYFISNQNPVPDWESSFRIALLLAIVIPFTQIKNKQV
jgi:hypothetical protein